MPITVGNGTLTAYFARLADGVIDAYVTYAFSNGNNESKSHPGIPLSSVISYALQHGRSEWTASDLCAVIAAGIDSFAPNTISPVA